MRQFVSIVLWCTINSVFSFAHRRSIHFLDKFPFISRNSIADLSENIDLDVSRKFLTYDNVKIVDCSGFEVNKFFLDVSLL